MLQARAALLLLALILPLARGVGRFVSQDPEACPGVVVAVDLAHDPPWRLSLLPGVGFRRAMDIIDDRERNGVLPNLEALQRVHAIGPGTVARLRSTRTVRVLLAGRPVGCPP